MATFKKITNDDIYEILMEIKTHVEETNGKVRLNTWSSRLALTFSISVLLALIKLLLS